MFQFALYVELKQKKSMEIFKIQTVVCLLAFVTTVFKWIHNRFIKCIIALFKYSDRLMRLIISACPTHCIQCTYVHNGGDGNEYVRCDVCDDSFVPYSSTEAEATIGLRAYCARGYLTQWNVIILILTFFEFELVWSYLLRKACKF